MTPSSAANRACEQAHCTHRDLENPHPWQMRPRVGHLLPAMGAKKAAGSVAGGRDLRRLYQAEVMTRGSDFGCLYQLAAGMTGGSQFSSFYDLHAQASLRDCQLGSRCRLRPGVTANFTRRSSPGKALAERGRTLRSGLWRR